MSRYQICVWAQTFTFLPRRDCDHTIITCQGSNVSGHKHEWAQTCVGTNESGHKRVWAQTCVGTNVSGHNRVGTIVWAQVCMGTCGLKYVWARVVSLNYTSWLNAFLPAIKRVTNSWGIFTTLAFINQIDTTRGVSRQSCISRSMSCTL